MKKSFFLLGLALFYLLIFFAPSKSVYFGAYFISTLFFYLASKNICMSLLFSLILSLFSDVGIAGSWFLMEPKELNLGSGWWISPMTLLILFLLPFSFRKKMRQINTGDLIILLFFLWNVISFVIYPYENAIYGIISLSEVIIVYFLIRIHLSKNNLIFITHIIISMLLFQSTLGISQFLLKRPLGLTAESTNFNRPYGYTTIEEENLFRITGTFGHPNYLASFLIVTLPFLLSISTQNKYLLLGIFLAVTSLIFTYSRAAWIIFITMLIIWFSNSCNKIVFKHILTKKIVFLFLITLLIFILFIPQFFLRLQTFSIAFDERGSMSIRLKLWQEGLNLITSSPFIGVGLNRSLEQYTSSPVTDIFEFITPSSFYKIHNIFIEMAAEIGLPGFFLFFLFFVLIIINYFSHKKIYYKKAAFFGLLGFIGISMLNPFFHTSQLRLFFLLSAIILA